MTAPVKPSTLRQRRLTRKLNKIAQSVGYETWGRLETAALRGEVVVVKVEPQEIHGEAGPDLKRIAQLLDDQPEPQEETA